MINLFYMFHGRTLRRTSKTSLLKYQSKFYLRPTFIIYLTSPPLVPSFLESAGFDCILPNTTTVVRSRDWFKQVLKSKHTEQF